MWFFGRKPTKEDLRGLKKIKVNGMRFTIKRINPFIDFSADKMPQIFTDYYERRKLEPKPVAASDFQRMQKDMYEMILAGVVEPVIKPVGALEGLTVEDLFRDPAIGINLYYEILNHSLNRFKGLKHLFFSTGLRFSKSILFASGLDSDLQVSSSKPENSA